MPQDSALTRFDDAVFISYTHLDNEPFGPDQQRWVSHLHEQLTVRVQQLVGGRVSVWRDDKLQGNDVFAETLVERLSSVAVLVSVCSPRYLRSDWCQRELDEFVQAAGDNLQVGSRSRLFKVLKTPVPLEELPQPLIPVLGYRFYEEVPPDRRIREFLLNPDPRERWKFYARVDDLAQDIAGLLGDLAAGARAPQEGDNGRAVYLAETTSDVERHRDTLRRELERRGHRVLPGRLLPLAGGELATVVSEALSRSELSIHLLGARYGVRPEGEERSIPHIQLDLAQGEAGADVRQLIWTPERLDGVEVAQTALIERLQDAPERHRVELMRAPLEAFKAHLLDRLAPRPPTAPPQDPRKGKRVYLVCDRDDRAAATAVKAQLEAAGHAVALPLSEGSASEARDVHEMELLLSDAVLIYYGSATEHWVRMKLFDLLKAPGWGRREPFQVTAVWVAEPATPHKARYATSEALVLMAIDHDAHAGLEPFLARLSGSTGNEP